MRFNPPPNWPLPPDGWSPPPGWEPDPSWPRPPLGWQLWIEEREAFAGFEAYVPLPLPMPWYRRTAGVVWSLILFFPLGLVLVWMRSDWSLRLRGMITGAVAVVVLIAAVIPSPPAVTAGQDPTADPGISIAATAPSTSPSDVSSSPTASTCGAPKNPYGYTFCSTGGSHIKHPAANVCRYFDCVTGFSKGKGYMVECRDGTYSLTGGTWSVCSGHHGALRAVYYAW